MWNFQDRNQDRCCYSSYYLLHSMNISSVCLIFLKFNEFINCSKLYNDLLSKRIHLGWFGCMSTRRSPLILLPYNPITILLQSFQYGRSNANFNLMYFVIDFESEIVKICKAVFGEYGSRVHLSGKNYFQWKFNRFDYFHI